MPITFDTLKLLGDDERKIVLTIVEDEEEENTKVLVKILKSAASANQDLVFGYVGIKQWERFAGPFVTDKSNLPKMVVWDREEEYLTVSPLILITTIGIPFLIYIRYYMSHDQGYLKPVCLYYASQDLRISSWL